MKIAFAARLGARLIKTAFSSRRRVAFYTASMPLLLCTYAIYCHSAFVNSSYDELNQAALRSSPAQLGWTNEFEAQHQRLANLKPYADSI